MVRFVFALLVTCTCHAVALGDEPQGTPPPLDQIGDSRVWVNGSEHEQQIYEALDTPLDSVGLEFAETPLNQVVEYLRDQYSIQTVLDESALEELGLAPDEPVICKIRNVSLRSALKLMLGRLDLTYVVHNDVLLITSTEEAGTRLRTAVYPVADLIDAQHSMDCLIDVLISTCVPEVWTENGGNGDMRPFGLDSLVVNTTQQMHEDIAGVLKALREAKKMNARHGSKGAAKGEVSLVRDSGGVE